VERAPVDPSDASTVPEQEPRDEIKEYIQARYINCSEACVRTLCIATDRKSHKIVRLPVHLPGENVVHCRFENDTKYSDEEEDSALLAFFRCSSLPDSISRDLLYSEMPSKYTLAKEDDIYVWKPRTLLKRFTPLGRMYEFHIRKGDIFYLRVLLSHVRGPTCFDDVLLYDDVQHTTFKDAAIARGLFRNDAEWYNVLTQVAGFSTAKRLRHVFVSLLTTADVPLNDPTALFNHFKTAFTEDFLFRIDPSQLDDEGGLTVDTSNYITALALHHIYTLLRRHSHISVWTHPHFDCERVEEILGDAVAQVDLDDLTSPEGSNLEILGYLHNVTALTDDQHVIYVRVLAAINRSLPPWSRRHISVYPRDRYQPPLEDSNVFFLQAPAGCGKSYIANILLAEARTAGLTVFAVATSGIASVLLEGGVTAHSAFKITVEEDPYCNVKPDSTLAKQIQAASLVIFDEAPSMSNKCIHAVDEIFKNLRDDDRFFGGCVFLFMGDVMQLPPVLKHNSSSEDIVNISMRSSYLWEHFTFLTLTENLRIRGSDTSSIADFARFLLQVGRGSHGHYELHDNRTGEFVPPTSTKRLALLPPTFGNSVSSISSLLRGVYGDLETKTSASNTVTLSDSLLTYFSSRLIVSPLNEDVDVINTCCLDEASGLSRTYSSYDTTADDDNDEEWGIDFLNASRPSGFPHHSLHLKIGSPIIYLRNNYVINVRNGTRLVVTALFNDVIQAKVITGTSIGRIVTIIRTTFSSSEDLPFLLNRHQFPVSLAYAVTVHKSQGQSVDTLGCYYPHSAFTHGMMYVTLSRGKHPDKIFYYFKPLLGVPDDQTVVQNVVIPELVDFLPSY